MEKLKTENLPNFSNGQIVVATQVIEAGVDVSVRCFGSRLRLSHHLFNGSDD